MNLTEKQGDAVVKYARAVIKGHFSKEKPKVPEILKDVFTENRGVFVTLDTYPDHKLRGCIGYPEPILPLGKAVEDSALSAALRDPRFQRVREDELDNIVVEVSVLTKPELIKVNNPKEYPKQVKIGRDGLIVQGGWSRGLLLPQVPVEWKWDAEEFLSQTCVKAGLTPDTWLAKETKIYSFQAQIFAEETPGGKVVEKFLTE